MTSNTRALENANKFVNIDDEQESRNNSTLPQAIANSKTSRVESIPLNDTDLVDIDEKEDSKEDSVNIFLQKGWKEFLPTYIIICL